MKLSYINDLFVKNTGISCPDELEEILIRIYIMPFRNFRNINKLLNLSPSMGQIEDWEKNAKKMKKPELSKTLENMNEDVYDQRWFLPVDESVKGKSGILKSGLLCEYVNWEMFNHCYQSYTALKDDMVFSKELQKKRKRIDITETTILTKTGTTRSYSRHPVISHTARMFRRSDGFNEESENKIAVADMVTSFMVKDNYEYDHVQGKGIYYCYDYHYYYCRYYYYCYYDVIIVIIIIIYY